MVKIGIKHPALLLFTGIICGILLTSSIAVVLISYRIDSYHQQIDILQNRLIERDIQLDKLSESLDKKKFILKELEVIIESDIDENAAVLIQNTIKQKLKSLIGKEIKTIDIDLVSEIVDKRIMKTDINQYKLKLKRLVLCDSLTLWIEADVLE